ncbi:phage portal protein [Amycolatopsis echigonensis]|uniref:Phage portal protein n=1 Tax=Amycolatopsis echigonensis TaxID=2576905 RepID=A0A8E1W3D4_9PSEU|nr:phage portal protein [Amycolatopsis echigonensis]MBB2502939.1 phage portal protein [Amycolatopsis echigonensis]
MGLGSWIERTRRATPAPQHSRMLVSDGWNIGSSALIPDDAPLAWKRQMAKVMGIPGVDRCVRLLSGVIGGLPWDAYTDRGRDFAEKIKPRPVLLQQPCPEEIQLATMSAWVSDLVLHGNAFGVITDRDRNGLATAVTPVAAARVSVRRSDGFTYSALPKGEIEYQVGSTSRTFARREVIHVKGLCEPGALRGLGVLELHLNGTLALADDLAGQARSVGAHGVPTGLLKATSPDVTEAQLIAAKQGWLKAQRERTIAALGPSTEFEALAWNPEELQLIEARKLSLLEIALIFGVPPRFLGASTGDSLTYSTSEAESSDLLKFSIGDHVQRIEQTFSQEFPRGTWVQANRDAILRGDTTARYQAHETGIRAGFLLKSEAREIEDLPPVPGIDDKRAPTVPGEKPATDNEGQALAENPEMTA